LVKRINPVSLISSDDSCDGSHYTLHSILILEVDLGRIVRFFFVVLELNTPTLPLAHFTVELLQMEGVAVGNL
jgi:hypothetical protein